MRKIAGFSALLLAVVQIILVICFDSLDWSLKSMILVLFTLFLAFMHCITIAISKSGFLQKTLIAGFAIQLVFICLLLFGVSGLKSVWYWQFSLAFISICIGIISSSIRHKVTPLVYYLQYLLLGIISFSLLALGMNNITTGAVTIGFSILCLMSVLIHLFTKEKTHST